VSTLFRLGSQVVSGSDKRAPVTRVALEARIAEQLEAGAIRGAATVALEGYGPQILGYLTAVVRDRELAEEAFSSFSEDLWKGLPSFQGASSFRTWAYKLAYHAALRVLRDPERRTAVAGTTEASRIAAQVRTETPLYLRTEAKTSIQQLREELSTEEQTLLILRVDRNLDWREVAAIVGIDEPAARKRFERLRDKLRRLAQARGLLPGS
jgi:RNA polymerase sigma-70 factor, ECF subfamily